MRHFLLFAIALVLSSRGAVGAEARLLLKPHISVPGGFPTYAEDSVNFYGTQQYLLESAMLRHRAEEALGHPAPAELKIAAERVPNTSIIRVTATSADDSAAAAFVGALVDEFLKFKREQKKRAFNDAIARIDAALKTTEASPDIQKLKQQLVAAAALDTEADFERLPDK